MAIQNDPITREEIYLNKIATGSGDVPNEPITRKEMYLAKMAGENVTTPKPITREEMYFNNIAFGNGAVPTEPITRSEMFLAKATGQEVQTPEPITRKEFFLNDIANGGGSHSIDTQPVIQTEDVCWSKTVGQTVAKEGFGITKWYGYEFTQEALESCAFWDSANGYMTQNGWSGLKYYISDANTLAEGYTWPASSNFKHELGLDGVGQSVASITKNAEGTIQFARYSIPALSYNELSFTIPLLDANDCYAYWYKPRPDSILPTGVEVGDIIFAGKNTPYYGKKNINE